MRTLTVTGHGAAGVVPDAATVRVAATHQAAAVAEALAGADSATRAAVEVARRHTDVARIGTTTVQLWPAIDHLGGRSGYEARHALTIRLADLGSAGELVTELADVVGDRLVIEGISPTVSDPAPAGTRARERAFADALTRATELASLAGAGLGEVQQVVEGREPGAYADVASLKAGGFALEAGETQVEATLTVTWQLV